MTLFSRRTCRKFKDKSISKKKFSTFLNSVSGMTRFYNESILDKRIIKTSPSGGARHPIEVYPIIRGVQGIAQGIYHYEVETDSLVPIGDYPGDKVINKLFSGQYWVENASVTFIFTASLPRSMWKYDHSRAYRVVLLDAGHLGQTFHLVGTALELGVFTTAAIQDSKIEKYLKIDGISEIVVYAGAIGQADNRI
jgi:SagB-type dehydrogenase family enzyme